MAQTTGPGSRTRGGTSASTNGTNTTGDGGARRGFSLSGLSALLSPRSAGKATGTNGTSAQPQRPNTGMGKFLKGWLILVVGMYVVQFGLIILDANAFGGWLEKHYIAGTGPGGTHPGSAFLLGGMTWFLLIFIALFAGLYYALVKFKILPKDLFGGARNQTQANARAGGSTARGGSSGTRAASPSSPPPLPSGVNPYADHSRAARREAQRRAAVAAVAPQPKRGLFGRSKPAAPVAAAATVATAAKKQTRAVETGHATTSADNHYQRVRAEQRQRKRRAARR